MSTLETHYSAGNIEERILAGLRAAGLDPSQRLSPESLGALDHFHTGGLAATRELLELSQTRAGHRVLDIGAGLGGAARLIATENDCQVDCIEMSADYCTGARLLNQLTGLEEHIRIHQGSALDLPFADKSFDLVWMQNVGMNIADKTKLYAEIFRALKPGGRYAFQEMAAGANPISDFPLPWATTPHDNFLITPATMLSMLGECGFVTEMFEDTSDAHLGKAKSNATPSATDQLGLSVFVDDLGTKARNARRSLEDNQVRLVRGVFRAG